MYKKIGFFIISLFLLVTAVFAEDKMSIAIMEMEAVSVPKDTAKAVSDLIRTALFNTGLFRVYERSEMEKVLKEQQFGMSGLSDIEYAVKVGKLLSAKKILVGSVSRLGQSYIVNARIIDVEKGEMEFADKAKSESESDLDNAVESFAKKIADRINAAAKGKTVTTTAVEPVKEETGGGGFRLKTTSCLCMGTGLVTGVVAVIFNNKLKKAYDTYSGLTALDTATWTRTAWDQEWDKVASPAHTRDVFRLVAIVTGGAGLIMYGVDYLFLRPSSTEKAMLDQKHNFSLAYADGYRMSYTFRW